MQYPYTQDQKDAILNVSVDVLKPRPKEDIVRVINGYAGTGKTTIIPEMINMFKSKFADVLIAAPTNKAVSVISEKMLAAKVESNFSTLHAFVYGKPNKYGYFVPKKEMAKNIFMIVDEASMITKDVMNDLFNRVENSYVLFLGDDFQLEPVGEDSGVFKNYPTSYLDEVVRHDNGILQTATNLRKSKTPDILLNDDVHKLTANKMIDYYLDDYEAGKDIIYLCATNKTRVSKNILFRKELGFSGDITREPLICINNNEVYSNGETFKMLDPVKLRDYEICVPGIPEVLKGAIYEDCGNTIMYVENFERPSLYSQQLAKLSIPEKYELFGAHNIEESYFIKRDVIICTLGFAISCHKCVDGDTWIFTSNGIEQIKNYVSGDVHAGFCLQAPKEYILNGVEKTITLTTKHGYELKATENHSQIILDDMGNLVRKHFKYLSIGDVVIMPKNINCFGNITDVFLNETLLPSKMTTEFGEWLGLFVADGCIIGKKGFRFLKRHKDVVERFSELTNTLFGIYKKPIIDKYSNAWKIEVYDTALIKAMVVNIPELCPFKKFVPPCVLKSSKEVQCAFLRGFSEDGSFSLKDKSVELVMKEDKLSILIQNMLLNIGIISHRKEYGKCYRLTMYGENVNKFMDEIGFVSEFKNSRMEKQYPIFSKNTFCFLRNLIVTISINNKFQLKSTYANLYSVPKCTVELANRFVKEFESKFKEDAAFKTLDLLLQNYYFQEINILQENEPSETFCFDMGGDHQFIQNGILSGNSQGSQFENVFVDFDYCSPKWDPRRWLYTGVTRATKEVNLTKTDNLRFI